MLEISETIPSYIWAIASIALILIWAAFSLRKRWQDARRSMESMLRSMERNFCDISRLPWIEGVTTPSRVQSFKSQAKMDQPETTLYRPELDYEYAIDGKQFTGAADTFHLVSDDTAPAEVVVNKYRPGTRVRIHFKRDQPEISYLGILEIDDNRDKLSGRSGDDPK